MGQASRSGPVRVPAGLDPTHRTGARCPATGKTCREEIAAGRRLPVQHFSRTKYAREGTEHQSGLERLKRNPTRRADGFLQWTWRNEAQRKRFDGSGKTSRVREVLFRNTFTEESSLDPFDIRPTLEVAGYRPRAARLRQICNQAWQFSIGC